MYIDYLLLLFHIKIHVYLNTICIHLCLSILQRIRILLVRLSELMSGISLDNWKNISVVDVEQPRHLCSDMP